MRHIRTKRNSKEKNQRYHSKIRALQHFGQQLTNLDLEKMAEIYRHSFDTRLLKKQTCRLVKAVITYNNNVYPIIYDKKRHQIVTILKPDYLNERERSIYNACYTKLLLEEKRTIECNVPSPIRNINIKVDVENDVVEDTSEYQKEVNIALMKPYHVLKPHVILPSEEEGNAIMEEAMCRINI